jgi:hypothetical protein
MTYKGEIMTNTNTKGKLMTKIIHIDSWGRFVDRPACDLRSQQITWEQFGSVACLNEHQAVFAICEDDHGCSWVEIDVFWTLHNRHIKHNQNLSSETISNENLLQDWKAGDRQTVLSGNEIVNRTEYYQGDRRRVMYVLEENLLGQFFLYQASMIAFQCTSSMVLIGYYRSLEDSFIITN